VSDYARQLEEFVTANPRALRDFFDTGVDYAKKFFDLGLAVIKLFLALGGQGGAAAEGANTIDYLRGASRRSRRRSRTTLARSGASSRARAR
jgi:hypothetical protein